MKRIQRKRIKGWKQPGKTKYCGRGSKWGNPFSVGSFLTSWGKAFVATAIGDINPEKVKEVYKSGIFDGKITLEKSLEWYRLWINMQIKNGYLDLSELKGYDYLSCWCGLDSPCHVDILIEKLNNLYELEDGC